MKKWILLAVLAVGAVTLSMTSVAKADHWSGCGPSYGGYYGGYSYAPSYSSFDYGPTYRYGYGPVNSYGYSYPSSGFYYGRPGLSISIGSGYRGYGYSGYGGHHHHHHGYRH